ncbi:MAG: efflux RND transporter periplasmic adaptor subunit [Verrucomicrobia bacterium]|nr:efflux RND transporter periplasmic adaptor subunit [Verrucomicrobiota bacterium]
MTLYSPDNKWNVTGPARLIILFTAVLTLVGCGSKELADSKSMPNTSDAPATKPALVELSQVTRGMIEEILERSSPLEAEAHVQVLARTQNPSEELLVEEGDKVEKGQVLLRLEDDRQRTDFDQAMSQHEEARIEFDRQKSLYDQSLVSESAFRNSEFAFNRARLQLETAKRQLEYTEVRAPIKGTVTSRTVKVGDQVTLGTPIFEIIDLESIVAVINVPEQYLPKLKPDMEARLISSTLGDRVFEGFVKRISPVVEARAGTIKVVVGVKELGLLRPGMWVDVELVLDSKKDALLIPKRSIVYDNDQTFAFKMYKDTNGVMRARRELVVPTNADKEHIEPTRGFEVGDLIVAAGHSGLKDDSPIRELSEPEGGSLSPAASLAQAKTNSVSAATKAAAQGVN